MFRKFSTKISIVAGRASAFGFALCVVLVWAISGPVFDFSNTWQLLINTFTTITTFLMVFLIQNTQSRDSKAVQLKLDELLIATRSRNAFVGLEDMTDEELGQLDKEFREIHEKQATSHMMKKLHAEIEAEHARRQGVNIFAGIQLLGSGKDKK